MEYDIKTILEKIILPVQDGWKLSKLEINEDKLEVHVYLFYEPKNYTIGNLQYKLYDDRSERKWRHLDLWQYKTFIYCNLPRYKDGQGKVKTIDIPWAEPLERMTLLLEKKL
jgi:hypothetical protein